ncbi:MAG: c-type cytochrome biogenesis protein CcmI [Betaproteobacteria bacterium]|nr:c-type cytochrome biogenesis protein CcmI [Betaproteobacteria bacterium]
MTLFWIICALLLAVALLFVVLPLWRGMGKDNQVQRDAANLEIFRDQIAEMDADLRNGLLTPELYEQGKDELQARLLEEVTAPEGNGNLARRNPHRAMAIGLAVLLSLAAVGLYWKTGNRDALLPQAEGNRADGFGTVRSETALKELQDKLAKNPQDADSLLVLARSYLELERYADSAKAYDKLTQLVPNEAQLWAEFADALAMASGQSLAGQPTLLLDKALKLDPNNLKALALSGSAAMGRGDYPAAIRYWEDVLKQVPKGSEDAKMIASGIQQARDFMAQSKSGKPMTAQPAPGAEEKKPAAAGSERITGTVTLSAALEGKARPNDMLFVLARAAEGPKAPLAVVRVQVKDLPLQFTLDDSMAMSPQAKLSNFDKVVVIARISRSGEAFPQPGDLQGVSAVLKPGSSGVKISIDSIVK